MDQVTLTMLGKEIDEAEWENYAKFIHSFNIIKLLIMCPAVF